MEKQAVEKELNNILNLYKACIDKNYLNELCESKGLLKKAKEIKEAQHKLNNFESVFRNVVANYDENVQKEVFLYFFNLSKIAKLASPTDKAKPKSNPTQDEVIKKEEKQKKDIIRKKIDYLTKQLKDNEYINKKINELEKGGAKKEIIEELEKLKELSFYEEIKKVKEDLKKSDPKTDKENFDNLLDLKKDLENKAKQNINKEKNYLKDLDKIESYKLREKIRDLENQLEDNDYIDNKIKNLIDSGEEKDSVIIKDLEKIKSLSKFETRAPLLKRKNELEDMERRLEEDEDEDISEEEKEKLKEKISVEKEKLKNLEIEIRKIIEEEIKILDEQTEIRNEYRRELGPDLGRGFIILMERKYGDFDPSSKCFLDPEGNPEISIAKGWGDIKNLKGFIIHKLKVTSGANVDTENMAMQALFDVMFAKTKEGVTLFTQIDKLLAEARKNKKLPLEVGPLILEVLDRKVKNLLKKENNNPINFEIKIKHLKEDIVNNLEQQKIEKSEEKLNELKKELKKKQKFYEELLKIPSNVHNFEDQVQTQSGKDFTVSEEMYENIVDVKEFASEIESLIYENDYLNPFKRFLKNKNRLLFEVFSLFITQKVKNVSDKKGLEEIIKKDLDQYYKEYTKRSNFIKNDFVEALIDFSFENKKISEFRFDLLKSLKDFLPKTFNLNAVIRIQNLLEQGKEITIEDLKEIKWPVNWSSKIKPGSKKSSILNVCEYLDVLIQKLS